MTLLDACTAEGFRLRKITVPLFPEESMGVRFSAIILLAEGQLWRRYELRDDGSDRYIDRKIYVPTLGSHGCSEYDGKEIGSLRCHLAPLVHLAAGRDQRPRSSYLAPMLLASVSVLNGLST
jgi:hypothetical protein